MKWGKIDKYTVSSMKCHENRLYKLNVKAQKLGSEPKAVVSPEVWQKKSKGLKKISVETFDLHLFQALASITRCPFTKFLNLSLVYQWNFTVNDDIQLTYDLP